MTYDEIVEEFGVLRSKASRPPADIGITAPDHDPVEDYRERIARSESKTAWVVWLPKHPDTILDPEMGRDHPVDAVVVADTGNGPTSEANARFIAFCFDHQRDIMDLMDAGRRAINAPDAT